MTVAWVARKPRRGPAGASPAAQNRARADAFRALVLLLVVQGVSALGVGVAASYALDNGARGWTEVLALLGLFWLVVVTAATAWAAKLVWVLRAEAEELERDLEATASQSHDWIWRATPELVLTYSSGGVQDILGFTPAELVGRSLFDLVNPDERPHMEQTLRKALQARTGWEATEAEWIAADGRRVWMSGSSEPIFDHAGRVIGFQGVRTAIDESRLAEKHRAELRARIEQVMNERLITMALQPIVDVGSGKWRGAEALARFRTGRPDQWFADAREAGLGSELERTAVELALGLLGELPQDVYLSVNASPATVSDAGFLRTLEAHRHCLGRVVLELTEHLTVADYDDLLSVLEPARSLGLRIAIDDTGSGYSSLTHVIRTHPDIVKIDRSLLSGIDTDPAKRSAVRAVVMLAGELGASAVAEGVETAQELAAIRSLGVPLVQGYVLAKPTADPQVWQSWRSRWASAA